MQSLRVSIDANKINSKRPSTSQSPRGPCHSRQRNKAQDLQVEIQEQHKCPMCQNLMVQPYLPPCQEADRLCHYCFNDHHRAASSHQCKICKKHWGAKYEWLADFDFERELKNTYGQIYLNEKAKIQKKFIFYENYMYEMPKLLLKEIESDDDTDDEDKTKTPQETEAIEYGDDTRMAQMQKMFQWNRGQQKWAEHVLNDKGKKNKKSKKFNDPFKHLGWDSHF